MKQVTGSRRHRHDLLVRPPCGAAHDDLGWAAGLVDPVAQLRELADLRTRGLLSDEQYEAQKAKVLRV
jgi:hypothetical protein